MQRDPLPTLRVLAGTAAAVRLAEAAAVRFAGRLHVAVALGVDADRVPRGCRVDTIAGALPPLAGATAVIDGLNPFDRPAVQAARDAAAETFVPRLAFRPPVWERHPLDRWIEIRDLAGAVAAISALAGPALLALPQADLSAFERLDGRRFAVRLTRPPARWAQPERFVPHLVTPPHITEAEHALLRRSGAVAVAMRATGAAADAPLVAAARALDLPIAMIRRPFERDERPARSIAAALDWVEATLSGFGPSATGVPAWR
jgi:precorrin-6A/cobalt-precorrin-6A reductase